LCPCYDGNSVCIEINLLDQTIVGVSNVQLADGISPNAMWTIQSSSIGPTYSGDNSCASDNSTNIIVGIISNENIPISCHPHSNWAESSKSGLEEEEQINK
jgi:hypothetical protein